MLNGGTNLNSFFDFAYGRLGNFGTDLVQQPNDPKPNIRMVAIETGLRTNYFTFSESLHLGQIDINIKMNESLKMSKCWKPYCCENFERVFHILDVDGNKYLSSFGLLFPVLLG